MVVDATDAGACTCASTNACCDGCHVKADGKKCTPSSGVWGTCSGGTCTAVPGSIVEWTVGSGTGLGILALSVGAKNRLAVATGDTTTLQGNVALLDSATGQAHWTQADYAETIALLPADATLLVVGTTPAKLLALADGVTQVTLDGAAGPVAASPDGKSVAAASPTQIRLYTPGGAFVQALDHAETAKARHRALAYAPDASRLASATGQNGLGSPHGEVKVFALANPTEAATVQCTSMGLQFSPDGKRLLTACWNTLALWDVATGKQLAAGFEKDDVLTVAWSPDGAWLAAGTLTGGVKLYDAATYTGDVTKPTLRLPVSHVTALAFSPDSQQLYVGTGSKPSVFVWSLPSAK